MAALKKLTAVTPIGKAEWFSLTKTDKFGSYTTNLILEDSPETHKLISQVDELHKENGGDESQPPYTKQSDGSFKLKLKQKSVGMKKTGEQYTVNPPVLYNALGKKIEGMEAANLSIGNGSEIRAKIEMVAYEFNGKKGISFKPKSVQISKIVEIGAGSTEDLGFDALELSSEDLGESESSSQYDF